MQYTYPKDTLLEITFYDAFSYDQWLGDGEELEESPSKAVGYFLQRTKHYILLYALKSYTHSVDPDDIQYGSIIGIPIRTIEKIRKFI